MSTYFFEAILGVNGIALPMTYESASDDPWKRFHQAMQVLSMLDSFLVDDPILKFGRLVLADIDAFRHINCQVDQEAAIEPYR